MESYKTMLHGTQVPFCVLCVKRIFVPPALINTAKSSLHDLFILKTTAGAAVFLRFVQTVQNGEQYGPVQYCLPDRTIQLSVGLKMAFQNKV